MHMKTCKLVICDIDGTIVVKHKKLTSRAKKVINLLQQNGIYFGIASGRPIFQIKETIKGWGYDDFDVLIGLNGSSLKDSLTQKQYEYFKMKKEWIKDTIELMKPFDAHPSIYTNNAQIFVFEDDFSHQASTFSGLKTIVTHDMASMYLKDNAKIMFRIEESKMPQVEEWIKNHPSEHYIGFKTQPNLIEFCDKRVSKGYALRSFCSMHDIDLEEVAAFGDTSNDNDMLKISGLGVCLLNGSEDTKAAADIITDKTCDEDGWADYMEKHFISKYIKN